MQNSIENRASELPTEIPLLYAGTLRYILPIQTRRQLGLEIPYWTMPPTVSLLRRKLLSMVMLSVHLWII